MKKGKFYPSVYFLRSIFCGKTSQPQVSTESNKAIKQHFITTGLIVAYGGAFDILVYNLQKPVKENVPWDYTEDYLNKIIMQKKLASKKKIEKTLTAIIKTAR